MPRPPLAASRWPTGLVLLLALSAGACASLIGLDDYEIVPGSGPGGGGAGGGTGGGGAGGGTGGGGAGGAETCTPGDTGGCYAGPAGTEGVGICRAGMRTCGEDGQWGVCAGEVLPALVEVCGDAALDETCDGINCPGDVVWAIAAGGSGVQYAHDVAVDKEGNVLVAGTFQGTFTLGSASFASNGTDGFLLKLNPKGELLWAKQLGGVGEEIVRSVAVDNAGNVYFTGYFDRSLLIHSTELNTTGSGDVDFFVAKLDPLGGLLWADDYGSSAGSGLARWQVALGIDVTDQGDVGITGWFNGSITFGGTTVYSSEDQSLFVAQMSATGIPSWIKSFGEDSALTGRGVAFGSAVHVTGDGTGTFSVGSTWVNAGIVADIFSLSFIPRDGDPVSAFHFGTTTGNSHARGLDIALAPGGDVLLTGYYSGVINFGGGPLASTGQSRFVTKRHSDGQHLWSRGFPAANLVASSDIRAGIAADVGGNVLLTGHFSGYTDFGGGTLSAQGTDLYVAKLDPAGTHIWSRHFGDDSEQYGIAVASDPTGHAVVTGDFFGQIDFGVATIAANGAANDVRTLFLAKLAP